MGIRHTFRKKGSLINMSEHDENLTQEKCDCELVEGENNMHNVMQEIAEEEALLQVTGGAPLGRVERTFLGAFAGGGSASVGAAAAGDPSSTKATITTAAATVGGAVVGLGTAFLRKRPRV
jgi:hypothetical protein